MKTKAFTLIELLVVIAIIAVLMAILMPTLRAAKDHARRIHCVSNVKTLALGWFIYQDDNDGAAWARVEAWARSRGCTLEAEATEREKAPRKPGDDARNEFPHDEFEAWLKSINENPGWYRRDDYSCEDDDGPRSEKGGKGDER